jgi:hypothetical protein
MINLGPIQQIEVMSTMFPTVLLLLAILSLVACTQEAEEQNTTEPAEPVERVGSAEQMGKQIDQAVLELKQRSQEAEAKLGDRLIEAGKVLKDRPQNGDGARQ